MQFRIDYKLEKVKVEADGKKTIVDISSAETGEVFTGVARKCDTDIFDMRVGYNIALRRAISAMIAEQMRWNNESDADGWADLIHEHLS